MEVPECYFHSSLWVKQVKKASPDSDSSSSQYSVILSQKIARLSEDKSGYSVQGRLEDSRETDRRLSYSCLFFALWSFPLVIPHPPPSSEEWGQEELAPWVWFVTLTCSPLETLSTRSVHKSSVWQSLSHLETFFCDGRSQRLLQRNVKTSVEYHSLPIPWRVRASQHHGQLHVLPTLWAWSVWQNISNLVSFWPWDLQCRHSKEDLWKGFSGTRKQTDCKWSSLQAVFS